MISGILNYVNSYADVRAVLGVADEELSDETLGLMVYRNYLNNVLTGIYGTYPTETVEGVRDLTALFTALDNTDEMYGLIQLLSVYVVADCVAGNLPMIGVKTKTEGKSVITRHSPESVYQDTRKAIKENLGMYVASIKDLFDEDVTGSSFILAVGPTTDIVTEE